MNKRHAMIAAVIAGVVVVGYVIYRYMQSRAAEAGGSPTGSFGSNLNSVAPELVGGSSGPSVGPALSAPVNITLNESHTEAANVPPPQQNVASPMLAANGSSTNALMAQNGAATPGSINPGDVDQGMVIGTGQEGDTANETVSGPEETQPSQPAPPTKIAVNVHHPKHHRR